MSGGIGEKLGGFFSGLFALALGALIVVPMLWVFGFFDMFDGSVGYIGEVDGNERPEREFVEPEPVAPNPAPAYWSCGWVPTMNEDWHDDVLCTRGLESVRPILLPDWSYVTQDDMMQAARDYEVELNR